MPICHKFFIDEILMCRALEEITLFVKLWLLAKHLKDELESITNSQKS